LDTVHFWLKPTANFVTTYNQNRNLSDISSPEEWLEKEILKFEESSSESTRRKISVPLKDDGQEYTLETLYSDQEEIVSVVLDKINEFMECEDLSNFKPLRLIINGAGGSGKSVVINAIVTAMRKMFESDDVVRVVAPTGTAAFNVHGQTFHHLLGNRVTKGSYVPNTMSLAKRKKLVKKFKCLLALIIDERSLVSNVNLGTAACQIGETIFEGGHLDDESWGGLPVVIIAGDDYQLPSMEEGAIKILNYTYAKNKMTQIGRREFLECAEKVMSLKGSKRISDDKQEDKDLVAELRIATETEIQEKHVKRLMNLRLDRIRAVHGTKVVEDIEEKAIYLFYKNEKRIRHNMKMLARNQSQANPVALLKARSMNHCFGKGISSHFDSEAPVSCMICVGCKVALENKNFYPEWGLHNGACGTVKEIVFEKGKTPNNGDLPKYVVVEFPLYCGPIWDLGNKKVRNHQDNLDTVQFTGKTTNLIVLAFIQCVPIPVAEYSCTRQTGCCKRTFIPLCLAYARTIHKFQGLTAGPVDNGKIKNMFDLIICDPDDGKFESSALGLFYTAVSRATTLGDKDGLNSAIYFIGEHLTEQRIRKIGVCKNSTKEFERVGERRKWVKYLHDREFKPKFSKRKKRDLFKWGKEQRYSYEHLKSRIDKYLHEKIKKKMSMARRTNKRKTPPSPRSVITIIT